MTTREVNGKSGYHLSTTLAEARQRTINYITHSTSCCFQNYPNSECALHTEAWVEREAAARVKNAAEAEEFHRERTSKLGDIVPKMSARKVGARLVEMGLRVSHYDARTEKDTYRASAAALDEDIARIVEEKGYPIVYWNIEQTVAIILDGPTPEQRSNWEAVNRDHDQYKDELGKLDAIIDHVAYLYPSEITAVNSLISGGASVKAYGRKALKRAYYDQKNGVALKLRTLEAATGE